MSRSKSEKVPWDTWTQTKMSNFGVPVGDGDRVKTTMSAALSAGAVARLLLSSTTCFCGLYSDDGQK